MHGGGYVRSVPMALQYRTGSCTGHARVQIRFRRGQRRDREVDVEVREMIRSEPESLAELDNVVGDRRLRRCARARRGAARWYHPASVWHQPALLLDSRTSSKCR